MVAVADAKSHWIEKPEMLWAYTAALENEMSDHMGLDRDCLRLGYSRPMRGGMVQDSRGYLVAQETYDAWRSLGHSLTHEVCGAAASQIVRPLQVKVVPSGGDPELIGQCEDASTAVNGVLDGEDFLTGTAQRVVMDGLHCAVGWAKVAVDRTSGDLKVTRVDPLLMRWPLDAAELYDVVEVQAIPRRRLLAAYKGNTRALAEIREAPAWTPPTVQGVQQSTGGRNTSDCIRVLEAFAVKLGDTKGRHVVALEKVVLEQEDYDYDVLPYAPYRWDWDFRGFDGVSLARTVAPYDVWRRELTRMEYEAYKAAIPVVWEQEGEEAFTGLTDLAYQRARFSGARPPEIKIAGVVSQDVKAQKQELREAAYAQAGVSLQAAQGTVPPGFKSAPSINAWSEVVNLRSLQQQQRYEAWYGVVGRLIALFAPDAYKGRGVQVRSPNAEYLREVKFPNLAANKYRVQVLMTSGLPRTFSGRVSAIETLKDLGAIKPGQEARMLEVPDLEAVNSEAMAPRKLAESIVAGALNAKAPVYPAAGVPNIPELITELLPLARARYMNALENGRFTPEALATIHRVIRVAESLSVPPPTPPAAVLPLPEQGSPAAAGMAAQAGAEAGPPSPDAAPPPPSPV